jgi:hypothetical protein
LPMEKSVQGRDSTLGEANPELDAKIGSMFVRSAFSVKSLSKTELVEGLGGPAGGEFFARLWTKGSAYRSFMKHWGDDDVQRAVVGLFEREPTIGASIEKFAGSNIARNRMRLALDTAEGIGLHEKLIGTPNGYELDSRVLSEEWGREIYGVLPRTVKRAALLAKISLPQLRHKESVKAIEPYVRPVSSNLLEARSGGLVGDDEINALLDNADMEVRYGAISEFFSTPEKASRLSRYLEKGENRGRLVKRLSENKPRALLAVMDALVSGFERREGVRNFAAALGDKNSSQVLLSLARGSLDDQELIFSAFNSEFKGAPIGKEVIRAVNGLGEVPFDRALGILEAVGARRTELFSQGRITASEVKKGAGDIVMQDAQMHEIMSTRQSVP